jgi:hypothetical protein
VLAWFAVGCGRFGFGGPDAIDGQPSGADAVTDMGDAFDSIAPPIASPEAWWRFEDDPADGALDDGGAGHAASCPGLCPTLAAGHIGNAYDFSSGAYLRVVDDGRFSAATALTVSGWVLSRSMINQALVSKPYMSLQTNSWQVEIEAPARVCASGPVKQCVDNVFTWSTWQHFAITYDGSLKKLYVKGNHLATWNAALVMDGNDIVIGADYDLDASGNFAGAVIPIDGLLDEVLIYARALSAAEIAILAAQ